MGNFTAKTMYFLDHIKQKPTIVILGTWVTQENSSPVAHEKCCHSALLKTQWFIRGHKNMYWGVSICQNRTIPEKRVTLWSRKVIPSTVVDKVYKKRSAEYTITNITQGTLGGIA